MKLTLAEKILSRYSTNGIPAPGEPVSITMAQTLIHDVNALIFLELQAMGVTRIQTELTVTYCDHNLVQGDYKNPDDHRFMQDCATSLGAVFSKPGNGVCHHLHLENFAVPGKTLLGCDSHTPTAGGCGMLGIGSGGLDVACATAGAPYTITMPKIVGIRLSGSLQPFVSAKDIALELLRRVGVKGGVGKIFEFFGPALPSLRVPERATITNMGTETGATTSIFPSDERTREWMISQRREDQWVELSADTDCKYHDIIEIDISEIEPLVAAPYQPDNVVPVAEVAGTSLDQVLFGSCTNSSQRDIEVAAHILRGKRVSHNVDSGLAPGSRQILYHAIQSGALGTFVASGVRILENSCSACNGIGFAPPTEGVSLRTINRNFRGRSGHKTGKVYLASPETAAASALTGHITDPRTLGIPDFVFSPPITYNKDFVDFIYPLDQEDLQDHKIRRGPNIQPLPDFDCLPEYIQGTVLLKLEDNITTDDIIPANAKVSPLRINVPEISKHTFELIAPSFYEEALSVEAGVIVAGHNYGQGSSREHAALCPRYLGIRVVLAKSFSRIHLANLINFGILPLTFVNSSDYDQISQNDKVAVDLSAIEPEGTLQVETGTGFTCTARVILDKVQYEIVKAGGKINQIRNR